MPPIAGSRVAANGRDYLSTAGWTSTRRPTSATVVPFIAVGGGDLAPHAKVAHGRPLRFVARSIARTVKEIVTLAPARAPKAARIRVPETASPSSLEAYITYVDSTRN